MFQHVAGWMSRALAVAGLALIAGLASISAPAPAAAQGTPEQRQACTDDAFRFCQATIPDAQRTKACLIGNMRRLSAACRTAFRGGSAAHGKRHFKARKFRHRHHRHHRRR